MTTSDSVAIRENIDAVCNGQRRGSVVLPGPEAPRRRPSDTVLAAAR